MCITYMLNEQAFFPNTDNIVNDWSDFHETCVNGAREIYLATFRIQENSLVQAITN